MLTNIWLRTDFLFGQIFFKYCYKSDDKKRLGLIRSYKISNEILTLEKKKFLTTHKLYKKVHKVLSNNNFIHKLLDNLILYN